MSRCYAAAWAGPAGSRTVPPIAVFSAENLPAPPQNKGMRKKPRVLNARFVGRRQAEGRVYVGRPTKWGNPFKLGRDGSRAEVIDKYRAWLLAQPALLATLPELAGKDLVCWCAPEPCHADILIEIANRTAPDRPQRAKCPG